VLAETVVEAARRFGHRPAVVAEGGWWLTYADLHLQSDEAAVGLARLGVGEGDVVAMVLPAVPEHFVVYAAAAKLGAVTAAVNTRLAPAERLAVLAAARPKVVVTTPDLDPGGVRSAVLEPAPSPAAVLGGIRVPGASPPELVPDPGRPEAVVFTSGTTGTPKGAIFTGRQLAFIVGTDVGPRWGGGGTVLAGPALAHLGPMTKLAGNLRRGVTQHLMATWRASEALRRIAELGITSVGGVPTHLALMLGDPEFDRYDLSAVRAIVIGGGPATPALLREARSRFGAPLAVRYSCTEAGIGTGTALDDPEEDAEVSVGRPQPGVSVRVVDRSGVRLPDGEVGEVVLVSPAVMGGYWHDPRASAEVLLPGGGVRTGDLGRVDDRGRLRLAGRTRERYVRGGNNVYPVEVEAVLADHPDVAAVAIVSRPDPVMGEVGVAAVVAREGRPAPTVAALRSFGQGRLAGYKLPDDVVVLPALPLTAVEKVDRRALEGLVREAEPIPGTPEGREPGGSGRPAPVTTSPRRGL